MTYKKSFLLLLGKIAQQTFMKNSRPAFISIGIAICAFVVVGMSYLLRRQALTATDAAPSSATTQNIGASANFGADINGHADVAQTPSATSAAPSYPADSIWHLTPADPGSVVPEPHADNESVDHHNAAIPVAELDTRPAAKTLRSVKAGADIELALPNGELARAHVNLVVNDEGVLRFGGALPDKKGGSFALALDAQSQLIGMILLRDVELAYTIEPGAQPGFSRMEVSALSDVICHPYEDPEPPASPDVPPPSVAQAFAGPGDMTPAAVTIPSLSSRPNAPAILYLEFNGATVTDPYWNSGNPIYAAAPNLTEAQITEIWKGVAEAYSPFNIDVTTDPARYAAMPAGKRMRCIITPTYQWYTNSTSTRGVALVNSFSRAGSLFASDTPCWIFVPSWYSYIPLVAAHELGHTLGLRHDGLGSASPSGRQEYFGGYGSGPMSWGPIMGNPSYRNINQWSKGEYAYASNCEDDIAIIASNTNGFGFHDDGIGKTRATATGITIPASGDITRHGILSTSAHEAWFVFTLASERTISLAAGPNDIVAKLDIAMQLQDAAGNVLASDNPSLALDSLIEKTLGAGTYYIKLQGASYADGYLEGYTRYGSIGQYTLTIAPVAAIPVPAITQHPQSKTATTEDASTSLSVAANGGGNLRYQWRKNGVDLASSARHANVTSPTLTILSPVASDAGQYTVTVRNAGGEVTSNPAALAITAPPPPVITTHPQSNTVLSTDYSFSLYVTATGAGTLYYQWQKDGVDLVSSSHYYGVNSSTLYVYSPEASDAGEYTVTVTNAGGDTISNAATITVTLPPPPVINTHPSDITREAGYSTSIYMSVYASGAGTLSYQWLKDGVDLQASSRYSGITSYYLYIYDYMPEDSGRYSVRVTNKGGSVTSNEAIVTITIPPMPVFVTHPSVETTLAGDFSASFYAYASGVGVKYNWQKDGVDLVPSSHYSGVASSSLTIYNPQAADAGAYTLRAWNVAGSVTSNVGTLTVNMPALPVITSQSGAVGLVEGENISLSCSINSVSNTTYQWYKDGQPISGAIDQCYSKPNASFADAGVYTLAATNPSGATHSAEITVTISSAEPPVFALHPETQSAYAGRGVQLNAAATGRPAPAYQWYKDGVLLSGQTSPSYSISKVQASHAGNYTVTATNKAGSATSNAAMITVLAPDSGEPLGIYPTEKEIGDGRVVYRVWVSSNTIWTVDNEAPWVSVSRTKGAFEGPVDITVAPNPIPHERTAIIMIAGIKHTLTQHAAGTPVRELWAAGNNASGQLGIHKPQINSYPKYISLNNVKEVAASASHALILKADGTLWAVGDNTYGQLGDGTTTTRATPVQVATDVAGMAVGPNFSLFLKTNGSLWSMGSNSYGQLGNGTTTYRNSMPTKVADNVTSVTAGQSHSLFVKSDGSLWGMGYNGSGQLGNEASATQPLPALVAQDVKCVTAGSSHTLYIKNDGTLWAMGSNGSGQLGNGATVSPSSPVQVAGGVQSASAGDAHSVFLKTDGSLWGMGRRYDGQLGDGTSYAGAQTTPIQITTDVRAVAAGSLHTSFIKNDGTLWATGFNYGRLGDGITTNKYVPMQIAVSANRVFSSFNSYHYYYIDDDSQLWGTPGALLADNNDGTQSSVPLHVASDVQDVSAKMNHTLYLATDSGVYSFGANGCGQLADGSTLSRSAPLKIATGARAIAAGGLHNLVIKSDGSLWGVGNNSGGQLGNRAPLGTHCSLVRVADSVRTAAAGHDSSFYIDATGALWALGSNYLNKLGVDGISSASTPVQVTTDAQEVSANYFHTLILKTDATLWAAGYNISGQLGRPNGGATLGQTDNNVAAIAAGYYHSLWLKNDGTIWAAGYNDNGQFGGSSVTNSTQTPVLTATNARAIASGCRHSFYIDTDNNLWAAGKNDYGQLADGTTEKQSIYKKIAANIDTVTAGEDHTLFIATGDIRLDPPPPPVITGFSPANITTQTKVVITGSNFTNCAGVYFGAVPADQYIVDSPAQITAYAPVIPTGDGGRVYVGTFDGVAASSATYSAAYAPVLGERIEEQLVLLGGTVSIEPPVLGTPDPAITWQVSTDGGATWAALPAGAPHSVDADGTLTITSAPLSIDGNRYRFAAANIHDTVISASFKLTIVYPPVVMAHPASETVNIGASVTFTADIDGSPAPALQWQISTDGGLTWSDIAAATAASHTIANTTAAMNGTQYRLAAANDYGAATTNPAALTVQWAPVQSNPVSSQTAVIGNTVTLSASISASPAASYQWQVSTNNGATWTNLADDSGVTGATRDTLAISAATAAMNGHQYRCIVNNAIGGAITQTVTLSVMTSPFVTPAGLFIDSGTLYVSDAGAHTIHRVSLDTNTATLLAGVTGVPGAENAAIGTSARFNSPSGIAIIKDLNVIHVLDTGNNGLRRITMSGNVTQAYAGFDFGNATGITVTPNNTLFIARTNNHTIARLYCTGSTYTLGTVAGKSGTPGSSDGCGVSVYGATFNEPAALAVIPGASAFAVADTGNHTIRMVGYYYGELLGSSYFDTYTLAGAAGQPGSLDGSVTTARFNHPAGLAASSSAIYVADTGNHTIRRIEGGSNVTTVAGAAGFAGHADGTGTNARFHSPAALAIDATHQNLYIADSANSVIRKLNLATHEVITLAISTTNAPGSHPVITAHPQNISATQGVGGPLTLTFSATGAGTLTSKWQKNGADITASGRLVISANSLSIHNHTAADSGQYRVIVSNDAGSVTSNAATVSVTAGISDTNSGTNSSGGNSNNDGDGAGGGALSCWYLAVLAGLIGLRRCARAKLL